MTPPHVEGELTDADLAAIKQHFAAIHAALPFLIGLEPQERKRTIKAGDNAVPFIRKSFEASRYLEDYLPRRFDRQAMARDLALIDALRSIRVSAGQLVELLDDTYAHLLSQSYGDALDIYRTAKRAQGAEGLEDVVAEMGQRFRRPSRRARTPDADSPASD